MMGQGYRCVGIGVAVWASAIFASTGPTVDQGAQATLHTAIACDFERGSSSVDHSVRLGGRVYKARLGKTAEKARSSPGATVVSGTWEEDVVCVTAVAPAAVPVAAVATGSRTLLVIFVSLPDLPYDPAARMAFESMLPQLTSFFEKSSRGALSLTCTVFPDTVQIKTGIAEAHLYWRIASETTTQVALIDPAYASYDHVMVALPYLRNLAWLGLGEVGGRYTWMNGNGGWGVMAHELGHNLGLNHAHGWRPTTTDPLGPGEEVEYGDNHDLMGNPYQALDFSNVYKAQLGWISPEEVLQITQPGLVALRSQGAKPGAVDLATVGYDPLRCLALQSAAGQPGAVEVRWAMRNGVGQSLERSTYLLDMTPFSAGGLSDALLLPGAKLASSLEQINISIAEPTGAGASDAVNLLVDCPILAPQLQIVWPPYGKELVLNERVSVTSSAQFHSENIAQAELIANGRVVSVSQAPPFDLAWTPTSLAVTNLSIRTRDIYNQTVVSTPISVRITWRPETNSWVLPGISLAHLTWGVDSWLAVANGQLCSSADLVSWRPVEAPQAAAGIVQAIARSSGGVVAVGSDGLIAFSTDGHSWFGQAVGVNSWNAVTAFGSVCIAAGDAGQAAVSADGQSWRAVTVLPGDNLIALAASDVGCVGLTANGRAVELSGLTNFVNGRWPMAVGLPRVEWPNQFLGKNVTCQGITWDGSLYWIIGSDAGERRLYSSRDGQVWSATKAAMTRDASLSVLATAPGGLLVGSGKFIDYRLSNGAWRQLMPTATQYQEIVAVRKQLIFLVRSDAGTTVATFCLPETLYDRWAAHHPPGINPEFLEYALGSSTAGGARLQISMGSPEQARIALNTVLRPDVRYIVEESTDLSTWTYALDLPESYPLPGPTKFFRLRFEPIPLY